MLSTDTTCSRGRGLLFPPYPLSREQFAARNEVLNRALSRESLSPSTVEFIMLRQSELDRFIYRNGNKVISREVAFSRIDETHQKLLVVPVLIEGKETTVFVVCRLGAYIRFYNPSGHRAEAFAETRTVAAILKESYPSCRYREDKIQSVEDSYNSALYVYHFIKACCSGYSFTEALASVQRLSPTDMELHGCALRNLIETISYPTKIGETDILRPA